MTYAEKLKDQRWQKKRLELLNAANWNCCSGECQNAKEKPTLHVHHKMYLRQRDPWDYPDFAYIVLCDECHEAHQDAMEKRTIALAQYDDLATIVIGLASKLNEGNEDAAEVARALAHLSLLKTDLFSNAARGITATHVMVWESFVSGIQVNK